MASDPLPEPEPKRPSAIWKWIRRLGCALLLIVFSCCGLTCSGTWWLDSRERSANREDLDRFHADVLQGGDFEAMLARADPEFRKKHSADRVALLQMQQPRLLERENLRQYSRKQIDGTEYVRVVSVRGRFSFDEWHIICKVVDGILVLIGISPGLDDLVPRSEQHRPSSRGSSRRHRHWFH